jgi:hypothetical protein
MKATDLIRTLLDYIDEINQEREAQEKGTELANTPCEKTLPVSAVTTDIGGGPNGIKHPADLRGVTVQLYPTDES